MRVAPCILAFLLASPLSARAQSPAETEPVLDDAVVEIVAITRVGLTAGLQVEYAVFEHVAPWLTVRYGTNNPNCALVYGFSDCGDDGMSVMSGLRFIAGEWGPVEPYVTLGLGRFWSDSGGSERVGTAHVGIVWLGFGSIRPRVEFGAEGHVNPWVNVGIGFVP